MMKTIDTIISDPDGFRFLPPRAAFVRRVRIVLRSVAAWIGRLLERRRSRMALLEMTDDQLKDIGISRADAYREGIRPPWE
ncbi:MAG: DUF1127 domain-containing protein [Mesorhizobium sp.]|nr:DUF1127 domain-containing protein [Mesorhizobium sp.]MBN9244135.1 DUF1127 domain-containing protein [Mesorhizobium sp.]MBN9272714.1 DUF1127 domain-containing protein [Mesorhizobium sp.]